MNISKTLASLRVFKDGANVKTDHAWFATWWR